MKRGSEIKFAYRLEDPLERSLTNYDVIYSKVPCFESYQFAYTVRYPGSLYVLSTLSNPIQGCYIPTRYRYKMADNGKFGVDLKLDQVASRQDDLVRILVPLSVNLIDLGLDIESRWFEQRF